jgi:hypothetical protein
MICLDLPWALFARKTSLNKQIRENLPPLFHYILLIGACGRAALSLIYQRRLPRREHIIAFRNKHLPDRRPPSDENMRRTGNAGAEPSSPMRHDSIKQASEPITAQKPTDQGGSLNAEGFMCALGLDLSSLRRQQQDNRERDVFQCTGCVHDCE